MEYGKLAVTGAPHYKMFAAKKMASSHENGLSESRERRRSRQNAPVEHFE